MAIKCCIGAPKKEEAAAEVVDGAVVDKKADAVDTEEKPAKESAAMADAPKEEGEKVEGGEAPKEEEEKKEEAAVAVEEVKVEE